MKPDPISRCKKELKSRQNLSKHWGVAHATWALGQGLRLLGRIQHPAAASTRSAGANNNKKSR